VYIDRAKYVNGISLSCPNILETVKVD